MATRVAGLLTSDYPGPQEVCSTPFTQDQSYLNWLVSFGHNYFNRNLPRRNSLMSAHLCLPRQLPCSFPVEIVELPLTPPHAWSVHANNRGKLISPTWNLFIKLSQFMVCQGNRLTGRGRMKTHGRWHFIDIICTKSCYNANAYSSPLFFSFFVSPRITLFGFYNAGNPWSMYLSVWIWHQVSHTDKMTHHRTHWWWHHN